MQAFVAHEVEGVLSPQVFLDAFAQPNVHRELARFVHGFDELGLTIPIITRMDFGHTDPFFVLPYGVRAEIDCAAQRLSFIDSAVV